MDAKRNVLPIEEVEKLYEKKNEVDPQEVLKKKTEFEKLAKESMEPLPPQGMVPQKAMMIKKGMVIHFYGFAYKCTAARPNGKVTLKFKGLWKGGKE